MKLLPILSAAAIAVGLGFATPHANATVIFSENFDTAAPGIPSPSSTIGIFTVIDGTVDVIPVGGSWDLVPNGGLYLDLDGTGTGEPSNTSNGVILTTLGYNLFAGKTYTLKFDFAGDNRGVGGNGVQVFATLGNDLTRYIIQELYPDANQGFVTFNLSQIAPLDLGSVHIGFASLGTPDQQGVLLDNISLSVPDGGMTVALLGFSLGAVAMVRRKTASI